MSDALKNRFITRIGNITAYYYHVTMEQLIIQYTRNSFGFSKFGIFFSGRVI